MRRRALLPAAAVLAVALAGCSTDVRGELRATVADLTADANARDADAVRDRVDELLAQVDGAVDSGELTSAEAARIRELAEQIRAGAELLEPEQTPSPTPSSPAPTTPSPTPSPTPTPTPSPTPTAAPSPSPTPPPSPTSSPEQPAATSSPAAAGAPALSGAGSPAPAG